MAQTPDQSVQLLQRQFIDSLPQKAHQLEDLWHHLRFLKWSDAGFRSFQQLVHRLSGSATSFGVPDVSNTAELLDNYLLEHQALGRPLGGIEYEMIDKYVYVLVRTMTQVETPETLSLNPSQEGEGKHIFIVEQDHALSSLMSAYLQAAGFQVKHFDTATACIHQLNLQMPHAVLIDPCVLKDGTLAFDSITDIKAQLIKTTPLVFISARTDIHSRLRALRAGCTTYITKPIKFSSLVQTLIHTINTHELTHKVMIVDDDAVVANYHAEMLRYAGMETFCVANPLQSLQRAAQFKPDLVIMDMHMPDVNGIELATLLRQDEQFLFLPIIFVTADTSTKLRNAIESIGVNAVLTKPVELGALVNACERAIADSFALKLRIENITQRAQHHQQINRNYFFSAIDNELHEPQSSLTPTALYYIGIDIPEADYREFGPTGIATLHSQFCQCVAPVIGSEEQWCDVSNFAVCVLADKNSLVQHQQRIAQIMSHLENFTFSLNNQVIDIHIAIGCYYLESRTSTANNALANAEAAYEIAKNSSATTDAPVPTLVEIDLAPVASIAFNNNLPEESLRICYQPMVSLESANIEHFEALVRWSINDEELIPAARFLHYIEHSTMRIELDRWVLQSAITTIATDHYARENACLFIHLANETLAQKSFFSFATNVLRSSRLRGQGRLVFIFEEPWIAANVEDAAAIIHSLHNIQCGACLSHAGSTEETENIIKNHHFDYVRLAPSLTAPLLENSAPYLKMQRIIQLAHEVESAVIATHVEDAKSLAQLWQMGIRLFQGFLLQTPEPQIRNHSDIDSLKRLIKASSANES